MRNKMARNECMKLVKHNNKIQGKFWFRFLLFNGNQIICVSFAVQYMKSIVWWNFSLKLHLWHLDLSDNKRGWGIWFCREKKNNSSFSLTFLNLWTSSLLARAFAMRGFCECNSSYNLISIFMKLCMHFAHGEMWKWFRHYWHFFHFLNLWTSPF